MRHPGSLQILLKMISAKAKKITHREQDWNGQRVCHESSDADAGLEEVLEPPRDDAVDVDHVVVVRLLLGAGHVR